MINNQYINGICTTLETFSQSEQGYLQVISQNNQYQVQFSDKANSSTLFAISGLVNELLLKSDQLNLNQTNLVKSVLARIVAKIPDKKMGWITFVFGGFVFYYIQQFTVAKARDQIKILNELATRKAEQLREEQNFLNAIEVHIFQLNTADPQLTDVTPFNFPEDYYWMLTNVGPFKPLGDHDNKFFSVACSRWELPFEHDGSHFDRYNKTAQAVGPIVTKCKQNCFDKGRKVKGCMMYDPQTIVELCLSNKDKIIAYAKDLEKTRPELDGVRQLSDLRKALEVRNVNQDECVDKFFEFLSHNLNLSYSLGVDPKSHFFKALGEAAFGDISLAMADHLNLPEQGLKEVIDMHRTFPQHMRGTIRNLFRYFEKDPYRIACVKAVLSKIAPSGENVYFVHENKLYKRHDESN